MSQRWVGSVGSTFVIPWVELGWAWLQKSNSRPYLGLQLVTARCYAERGIAMASCLSVCQSETLRYCDYIGWKSSKIISWLVSLVCSLFATPTSRGYSKGNTLKFGLKVAHAPDDLSVGDNRSQYLQNYSSYRLQIWYTAFYWECRAFEACQNCLLLNLFIFVRPRVHVC